MTEGRTREMALSSKSSNSEGVLPYVGYIGTCSPKRWGFSAVLVINIYIGYRFGHFGLK